LSPFDRQHDNDRRKNVFATLSDHHEVVGEWCQDLVVQDREDMMPFKIQAQPRAQYAWRRHLSGCRAYRQSPDTWRSTMNAAGFPSGSNS
jgi:hypothetical protein